MRKINIRLEHLINMFMLTMPLNFYEQDDHFILN